MSSVICSKCSKSFKNTQALAGHLGWCGTSQKSNLIKYIKRSLDPVLCLNCNKKDLTGVV